MAAWLVGFRSANTRAAYAGDIRTWLAYCASSGLEPVAGVERRHADAFARALDAGMAPASAARRLAAVASWYAWLVGEEHAERNPLANVRRPRIDPDDTRAIGLSAAGARALLAAADADGYNTDGRSAAIVSTLLHSACRVAELLAADVEDLGVAADHRVLTVTRKGGKRQALVLPAPATRRLDSYLQARRLVDGAELTLPGQVRAAGRPLIATATGRRMRPADVWLLMRRLAKEAGLAEADRIGPHSLRHTAATLAREAGAELADLQDWLGHADPRTTRRYDRARGRLDRSPAYGLATALAD